uniref:Protein tyrosine phosphatase receptor type Q n=1 Tax=Stegastes partitus TaxID=144197 RepID=A0A3B5A5A5_9TELE
MKTSVNVTWQPPLMPNGVIIEYSLELWNSTHYLNLTSKNNYIHITHLRKYAQYRVTVQAHTRVGPGNHSSEPLNITTLEDGERDGKTVSLSTQTFISEVFILCDRDMFVGVFLFSSKFCSVASQRGDNRVYPHSVWPRGLQHNTHPQHLVHPH